VTNPLSHSPNDRRAASPAAPSAGAALSDGAAGKAAFVRAMFARIVPRYDLVNRLMTIGLDRRWRRETAALTRPSGAFALDIATGKSLREIEIGPVFCGPSLSRGRVYVGGGNTVFTGGERRIPASAKPAVTLDRRTGGLFPLQNIGCVRCFGLPD